MSEAKKKPPSLSVAAEARVEECVKSFTKRLRLLAVYYAAIDVRNKRGGEPAEPEHVDHAHFYLLDERLPGADLSGR